MLLIHVTLAFKVRFVIYCSCSNILAYITFTIPVES